MGLRFDGKVSVVFGAGSGIGAAVSQQLAEEGAEVIVADRDENAGRDIAAKICTAGGKAFASVVDVADASAVEMLIKSVVEKFGGVDLAVNSAAIGGARKSTADYPLDDWRNVMNVNLDGTFHCMKYEIAAMQQRGGGSIVNMSSVLGSAGLPTASAYTAAKHAIVGLTKVAAMEYARAGIRINAVGPGWIDTPMLNDYLEEATVRKMLTLQPMGRRGKAEEVAEMVCFLLSDQASFVTGGFHLVDGAYTAH